MPKIRATIALAVITADLLSNRKGTPQADQDRA
jgi:hypothetical protein